MQNYTFFVCLSFLCLKIQKSYIFINKSFLRPYPRVTFIYLSCTVIFELFGQKGWKNLYGEKIGFFIFGNNEKVRYFKQLFWQLERKKI